MLYVIIEHPASTLNDLSVQRGVCWRIKDVASTIGVSMGIKIPLMLNYLHLSHIGLQVVRLKHFIILTLQVVGDMTAEIGYPTRLAIKVI